MYLLSSLKCISLYFLKAQIFHFESRLIYNSKIIQIRLILILCGQTGICQIAFFIVPFFQSTIIEHLQKSISEATSGRIPAPWFYSPGIILSRNPKAAITGKITKTDPETWKRISCCPERTHTASGRSANSTNCTKHFFAMFQDTDILPELYSDKTEQSI